MCCAFAECIQERKKKPYKFSSKCAKVTCIPTIFVHSYLFYTMRLSSLLCCAGAIAQIFHIRCHLNSSSIDFPFTFLYMQQSWIDHNLKIENMNGFSNEEGKHNQQAKFKSQSHIKKRKANYTQIMSFYFLTSSQNYSVRHRWPKMAN